MQFGENDVYKYGECARGLSLLTRKFRVRTRAQDVDGVGVGRRTGIGG